MHKVKHCLLLSASRSNKNRKTEFFFCYFLFGTSQISRKKNLLSSCRRSFQFFVSICVCCLVIINYQTCMNKRLQRYLINIISFYMHIREYK